MITIKSTFENLKCYCCCCFYYHHYCTLYYNMSLQCLSIIKVHRVHANRLCFLRFSAQCVRRPENYDVVWCSVASVSDGGRCYPKKIHTIIISHLDRCVDTVNHTVRGLKNKKKNYKYNYCGRKSAEYSVGSVSDSFEFLS